MLLLAGGHDVGLPPAERGRVCRLVRHAELAVPPGVGQFPWLDVPRGSRGRWRRLSADRVEQQRRGHRRAVGADRAGHGGCSCAGLGVRAVLSAADRDSVVGVGPSCAVPMPRAATRPASHARLSPE